MAVRAVDRGRMSVGRLGRGWAGLYKSGARCKKGRHRVARHQTMQSDVVAIVPLCFFSWWTGKGGVAASKNWKASSAFRVPLEWNKYIPKKIDTQKVYGGCGMKVTCNFPPTHHDGEGVSDRNESRKGDRERERKRDKKEKRTAPSVPKWSPTSVLTGPDQA